jgi:hypothetical protein
MIALALLSLGQLYLGAYESRIGQPGFGGILTSITLGQQGEYKYRQRGCFSDERGFRLLSQVLKLYFAASACFIFGERELLEGRSAFPNRSVQGGVVSRRRRELERVFRNGPQREN